MRICLVAHGYPPELVGGTETSVQGLARGLAARGHDVAVVAGSMQHEQGFRTSEATDVDPVSGARVRVHRIHRADLFFDHWQKSGSERAAAAFRAFLREARPDLVHVNHWIRLSHDLVACAAREGIPAAVTLHDLWTSCLVSFRVRPDTKEFCEVPLAPHPCLSCAALVPPRTPWVPAEAQAMALAERRAELVRELRLARAVLAPTRTHAEAVAGLLGVDAASLSIRVVPHGRELDLAPRVPLPPPAQHGRLVLGAWGHLHPLKGPDLLVEAVRRAGRLRGGGEGEGFELRLAGGEVDPGFAARLRELAAGLEVALHGPFEVAELDRHPVSEVHAMVSGTRAAESWGLVVDEAAALRLPLVLPRAGAFPERLREGRGALFYEPRDAGSLAEVLVRLRDEPGLLERTRAALPPLRELVPAHADHVELVLATYGEVLAAGAPAAPPEDWWRARMRSAAEEEWDRALARRSAAELGFP